MAGNKETFQKFMNQGHTAAWDQAWDDAAKYYRFALEEFPNHPQALSSLGLALFELQDYSTSQQYYMKAASISPEDPVPQEKIARIYERLGKLDEAIRASLLAAELHLKARSVEKAIDNWNHVLILQPDHVNVRMRLAMVYEKLGRRDEAIAEFIAVASILQRSGDLTQATKTIEYAQKIMPESQEVRLALSTLRNNRPLPRPNFPRSNIETLHSAQKADIEAKIDPLPERQHPDPITETRQRALGMIASLLFDQAEETTGTGNSGRAKGINALARGIADPANEEGQHTRITLHLGQGIESLTQGDDQQAIVELEQALNLGLRHPAAYFILGLLLKDQNIEKATKHLQQAVKHPDCSLASNLLLAQIHEKSGRWSEASVSYLQALALADAQVVSPDKSDALLSQYDSIIDAQSSVVDQSALEATCKTISAQLIRPAWREILKQTRQNLSATLDSSSLAPVAEMLLETQNIQVAESMAHVHQMAAEGMLRSALEEAFYVLQFAPTYLPLHEMIGDLLMQDRRPQEAVQKYLVTAELYMIRGEVNRATRLLKRISQNIPSDVNLRRRLIDLLVAQEKNDEALQEYWSLAELFYHLAELDKARQTYLEALKIAQKSKDSRKWGVNLLLKVADIDMQQLKLRQALRIFEQIRTMMPDHSTTRAQIIGLNFRLGQDVAAIKELDDYIHLVENTSNRQVAIHFINDLLIEHPDRLDLRKRLADLLIHNGEIDQAVVQLDAVADALLTENKNLEAVNMLETIISLNPSNVQDFRAALETLRRDMLRK